jgi:hydrogenase maturation protease
MNTSHETAGVLILGIGNVLMGDEGVGVRVVERLQETTLPEGVECLDGGTGSFVLLEPMQKASRVILIDATVDGAPAGTVRRLQPRYSTEYPRTLTAHDIGLKDLLDAFYLLGQQPEVTLFAVSIEPLQDLSVELSPEVNAIVPDVARAVLAEATCGEHVSASASS